ncbi:MAG: hypothetical protein PQJ47_02130 [Sphaerochaetaceae bacterium]|nr:hypothetical protein [Sphaerochaetaceae bacterium]MDC7247956.1 hypothetical protein [Sphaerochaetaceae bacterium]
MARRKKVAAAVLMMVLLLNTVGARNLFDTGLKVVSLYDADQGIADSSFFEGMGDGYNWDVGVGIETRFSFLHLSGMITNHEDGGNDNGMNFYASALFDIPVINDFLYLKAGGGISNTIYLPESEDESFMYGKDEVREFDSFGQMVSESPIHLKAGVDIIIGPTVVSLFYLRETSGTFGESIETILSSSGTNKAGAGLTLSLF